MTPLASLAELSSRWPALSELLDVALALPVAERAAWLAALSGADAQHRDTLRALLAVEDGIETDFLLDMPALPMPTAAADAAEGSVVGPYKLLSKIGEGGMATVWLAERVDGAMKRQVALKLPRAVWGDAFAARLGRERDILASLTHERIARLYDAGVDAQGRPFLAMEVIDGKPIDVFCRERQLPLAERIDLLLQVMAAVAHAHAQLVVHRDLKPSNILVSADAKVSLLDFGIAKLLGGDLTEDTALTRAAGHALTLDYASPEQIRGEPLGTASEIYSLAVVAFELLAGVRPYRLKRAGATELADAIAAVEAPLASDVATDRTVKRQLRGDLDAILNKALKKRAGERYPTVDAFAQDFRRWRAGEPVLARPDGIGYRAAKFVGRYRLQVGAGVVVAVALLAGTAVALWQAREAQHAAATAEAVQGFIESVFNANSTDQPDPEAARATTARQLLDSGAERIDKELASAPEAQLRLYNVMALMYGGMSSNERALTLQRRSVALATRLYGPRSDAALDADVEIGLSLEALGRRDEVLPALLEADAAARGRRHDDDHVRMKIDTALAHVYFSADPPKGLERARHAAVIARRLGASPDAIDALFILGENARRAGRLAEARLALTDVAEWSGRQGATGALPNVLSSLGEVQDELGQLEAAGATHARAVAMAERVGDPRNLHISRYKLARYLYENRLLHEALASAGPEAAWARGLGSNDDFGDLPAVVVVNYGRVLVAYGDAEGGLAALDQARALLPPGSTGRMEPLLAARADALVLLGRSQEAAADIERALTATPGGADSIPESMRAVQRRVWVAAGRAEDALRDFRDHPQKTGETDTAQVRLRRHAEEAQLLLAAGHDAEARSVATDALATLDRLPERRFERDAEAKLTAVLGQALLHSGQAADARPVLERALALHVAQYDPARSPAVAKVRVALAEAERRAAR